MPLWEPGVERRMGGRHCGAASGRHLLRRFRRCSISQLMNERSFVNAARVGGISKCIASGILQQGARTNSRRRFWFCLDLSTISKIVIKVWNLRLKQSREALAQAREIPAGGPAWAQLRGRAAASQLSVWSDGAALPVRPMQVELSGLRTQGRGVERRWKSDRRRGKSPAIQYLRGGRLSRAGSVCTGAPDWPRIFACAVAHRAK